MGVRHTTQSYTEVNTCIQHKSTSIQCYIPYVTAMHMPCVLHALNDEMKTQNPCKDKHVHISSMHNNKLAS